MGTFDIEVVTERCTGCLRCQLACSDLFTKTFNPSEAPGFKDYVTENPLSRLDAEKMIEDYYEEWGWDRKTGIPSEKRLKELEIAVA